VTGSVILVGGDPGIGKSTMLLQAIAGLSRYGQVLYVSGEESPEQIKIRAERLSVNSDDIILLSETSLRSILDAAMKLAPKAIVIDSIQTVYTEEILSAPGSVSQVRECAAKLMLFAKKSDIPVFLVGHVTKEGAIAGPRVLEHIVDTVLYFEGDRGHAYRILRTVKNRFGSTNEIGVFEMSDSGLREIENPSELFLLERPLYVSGSTVVAALEGTRPLMVEIQSLVSQTNFGMPRRTTIGVDFNRVNLLVAVLEKRVGLHLGGMDIFVNVVGGLRIIEPAVDLGIISTIASSLRDIFIDPKTFVFGEIGLSGEIRAIAQAEIRIKEASKIGFKKAVMPLGNADKIKGSFGLEIIGVKDVESALDAVLN
jgi:DNA repair protein RadA/Sms